MDKSIDDYLNSNIIFNRNKMENYYFEDNILTEIHDVLSYDFESLNH